MDTFRDLSPDEQRLALLQFIGQHLTGDLKELEKNLVSKSSTLKGMTLDPATLVRSIPSNTGPYATVVNAGINTIPNQQPIQQTLTPSLPQTFNDPNQLEFDFNNSNYAKLIFDRLDAIDKKLVQLTNTVKD
jgi:hypothetical protein